MSGDAKMKHRRVLVMATMAILALSASACDPTAGATAPPLRAVAVPDNDDEPQARGGAAPTDEIPDTVVVTPGEGADVARPTTVSGVAADDRGIDRVKLTVKDTGTGRYWNPQTGTWQDTWLWYDTTLDAPGATETTWSFTFDPGDIGDPDTTSSGRYRATAYAWDTGGQKDPVGDRNAFTSIGAEADDEADLSLVWADEFTGTTLDPNRWKTFSGLYGTPYRNQSYTSRSENVRVADGALVLEAHPESRDGQDYTSGMVVSNDVDRPSASAHRGNLGWTHGRFEVRARVPDVSGLWPAFWLRPQHSVYGYWPRSGEIDVMEYPGPTPTSWNNRRIVNNLHWYDDAKPNDDEFDEGELVVDDAWLDEWHTYAVEWEEGEFRWYIDGELSHRAVGGWDAPGGGPDAPFDQPFFITLNLQVGGWAGTPVDAQFPGSFAIDYVRVYQ